MYIERPEIYIIHSENAEDTSLIDRIWGTNIPECFDLDCPNPTDLLLTLKEGETLQDFMECWGELVGEETLDEALGGQNG